MSWELTESLTLSSVRGIYSRCREIFFGGLYFLGAHASSIFLEIYHTVSLPLMLEVYLIIILYIDTHAGCTAAVVAASLLSVSLFITTAVLSIILFALLKAKQRLTRIRSSQVVTDFSASTTINTQKNVAYEHIAIATTVSTGPALPST